MVDGPPLKITNSIYEFETKFPNYYLPTLDYLIHFLHSLNFKHKLIYNLHYTNF